MNCSSYLRNNVYTDGPIEPLGSSNHKRGIYVLRAKKDWSPSPGTVPVVRKDQLIALKTFASARPECTEKCEDEFKLLKACKNDFIVVAYEQCTANDSSSSIPRFLLDLIPFYLMEKADCSLDVLIYDPEKKYPSDRDGETGSPYTLSRCLTYLKQVCAAMEYLHKQRIMHRDIKSFNILMFSYGKICKVCDFDHSKFMEQDCHTHTPDRGTGEWMAPEVYSSRKYTEKADCYSFGMLVCELLFRKYPKQIGRIDEAHSASDSMNKLLDPSGMVRYINTSGQKKILYLGTSEFVYGADTVEGLKKLLENLLSAKQDERFEFTRVHEILSNELGLDCSTSELQILNGLCPRNASNLHGDTGTDSAIDSAFSESNPTARSFVTPSVFYDICKASGSAFSKREIDRITCVLGIKVDDFNTLANRPCETPCSAKISVVIRGIAVGHLELEVKINQAVSGGEASVFDWCKANEEACATCFANQLSESSMPDLRNLKFSMRDPPVEQRTQDVDNSSYTE